MVNAGSHISTKLMPRALRAQPKDHRGDDGEAISRLQLPSGLIAVALIAAVRHLPLVRRSDPGAPQLRGAFPPDTGRDAPATTQPGPTLPANTTVVPRAPSADGASAGTGQVNLVALLTVDGQRIDKGLVWRVFAVDARSAQRHASS